MQFLQEERATLEKFLPALDGRLRGIPLAELERPGSPAIGIYRELKGPGLLIPREHGGLGANPVEAVRIHRAVASRSPSLAVAVTMHNFSVATLVEYCLYGGAGGEFLQLVSGNQLLVASGFAEGRTGASIMVPTMQARRVDGGYIVNGQKRPCSLTQSMHLLTASVAVSNGSAAAPRRAVAIIPAETEGIERRPFWQNWVLAGAESDELILKDVFVPDEYVFFPDVQAELDAAEMGGFLWFELLITASYLGVASALAERALATGKGGDCERVALGTELEGAMAAVEGVASLLMQRVRDDALLARALFMRYSVQGAIERAAARSAELLGGMAFIGSSESSYLLAASRGLAFHPPSRVSIAAALSRFLAGEPFRMI